MRRPLAFIAACGLSVCAFAAVSCKRTWDNCYDPLNPPCVPTVEVVNCKNAPSFCGTPPSAGLSACFYCQTAPISACSPSGTAMYCQNALCYRLVTRNYGVTITRQRAYWPGTAPAAWHTPFGGPIKIEAAETSDAIGYQWCTGPSQTPVVGLAGQPVVLDLEGQFDDDAATKMSASVNWRP